MNVLRDTNILARMAQPGTAPYQTAVERQTERCQEQFHFSRLQGRSKEARFPQRFRARSRPHRLQ
jgi:hypothetical protein